jgi:hypothetical protein
VKLLYDFNKALSNILDAKIYGNQLSIRLKSDYKIKNSILVFQV